VTVKMLYGRMMKLRAAHARVNENRKLSNTKLLPPLPDLDSRDVFWEMCQRQTKTRQWTTSQYNSLKTIAPILDEIKQICSQGGTNAHVREAWNMVIAADVMTS
jgi:hypothetical protein